MRRTRVTVFLLICAALLAAPAAGTAGR